MTRLILKILNFWEKMRRFYTTQWVEDLPDTPEKNTVYIIGGREYPYYAAVTCPRKKCGKIIHLEISPEFQKRWTVKEHENGNISIYPSIHVTGAPCKCHYWLRNGRVLWSEIPPLFVPEENRHTPGD